MKVLVDSCVSGIVAAAARVPGHDVSWTGDWPNDPGDDVILSTAKAEGRVVVTIDKDFGELAVLRGVRHAGIVRLVNLTSVQQAAIINDVLKKYEAELSAGAIVTVESFRVRIRPGEPE